MAPRTLPRRRIFWTLWKAITASLEASADLFGASWPWLVNRGVFMTPGDEEQWTLSVQHTEEDVAHYLDAYAEFCAALTA